jgi:hypothetical protein
MNPPIVCFWQAIPIMVNPLLGRVTLVPDVAEVTEPCIAKIGSDSKWHFHTCEVSVRSGDVCDPVDEESSYSRFGAC